jgi:hypothetical protein
MPTITATPGNVVCDYIKPVVTAEQRERVDVWQTPGRSGSAAQLVGFGDSQFRFTLVLYDLSAAVETWRQAAEAIQGYIVTIDDDWSVTWSNCLVTQVGPMRKTYATDPAGTYDARGEITIQGTFVTAGG